MPALVPIVSPAQVVDAVAGQFFSNEETICVANIHRLTFYDSNFQPCSLGVPTANAISDIGVLRVNRLDSLVICVPNHKRKKSLVCIASCKPNQISVDQVFEYDLLNWDFKFLCTNCDKSIAVIRLLPGQLLVLRVKAGKVVAKVYGGTWGHIIDACFDSQGELVLLENLPSMSPSVSFNSLNVSGIVQNRMLVPVDLEGDCTPRLFPWNDSVLITCRESIQKITENKISVLCRVTANYIALHNNELVIGSQSGAVFAFNSQNSTLKKIHSFKPPGVLNMLCVGHLALAWGQSQTCILELPSGSILEQWPTLGPIEAVKPFKNQNTAGVLLSTLHETHSFEYSASATLAAELALQGICRLVQLDSLLLVSTPNDTIAFEVNQEGISQADSVLFYNLEQETLAANKTFQVTPSEIKTLSATKAIATELAAVTHNQAAVFEHGSISTYNANLDLEATVEFVGPKIMVYAWEKLCIAGDSGVYIDELLPIYGVSDMIHFNDYLVVGTKEGSVQFYTKDLTLVKEVQLVHDPVSFCIHNNSLLVVSNKVLVFDGALNCTRLVLGQPISMLTSLSDSMVCGVQANKLSIFYTQNSFRPELKLVTDNGLNAIDIAKDGLCIVESTQQATHLKKFDWDCALVDSLPLDLGQDNGSVLLPIHVFTISDGAVVISGGTELTCKITLVCGNKQSSFDTNIQAPMYASRISDGTFRIVQENRKGILKVSPAGIDLEYTGSVRALPNGIDASGPRSVYSNHFVDAILDDEQESTVLSGTADSTSAILLGNDYLVHAHHKLVSGMGAFEFDDTVVSMAREGANGAILGTLSGGVYLYIQFDLKLEQELLKLWSIYEQTPRALFQTETELVRWDELEALAVQASQR